MTSTDRRRALITGASAGIGTEFAHVFAARGFDVVLTARRRDRLERLCDALRSEHGVAATAIAVDLADPEAPLRLFEETEGQGLPIDALINNAGYGVPGYFGRTEWKTHSDFLQVMLTSVVHLIHLYESKMMQRGYGRILNVASLAGLVPGSAGHTLYAPAKAFLIKMSESLALEHSKDNLHVTALCPGFTYTEFHDVLGNRHLVNRLPKFMWMDARAVAEQGFDAVMRGDPVCVNGNVNRAIAMFNKLLPHRAALHIMRRQSSRIRVGRG